MPVDFRTRRVDRRGFTIVEFLLVVAIIGVLIALFLPMNRSAGPAARRAQCVNNLKMIAFALRQYEQVYKALPPSYTVGPEGRPLHSWRTLVLPYMGQEALYRTIDLSRPWDAPVNARALATSVPPYHCPESGSPPNTTTYLASAGRLGWARPGQPRPLTEITDDPSLTMLIIEAGQERAVPWMAPIDADESLILGLGPTTKTNHAGGQNVGFADGSVRFLKGTTPASVRRAMMTIAGDEVVPNDGW